MLTRALGKMKQDGRTDSALVTGECVSRDQGTEQGRAIPEKREMTSRKASAEVLRQGGWSRVRG